MRKMLVIATLVADLAESFVYEVMKKRNEMRDWTAV